MGQNQDGDPINVLVIDSEGIGALDEDSSHDSRIFALAILLSSCFIYNSVGSIDENAIQNLSLVVNLTKNIQVKASQSSDEIDTEDYSVYFPTFMWVVRDFTLQLVNPDGEPITPREYLEKALSIQKGFSESIESKNRIRRLLSTFFKERDCFTMVRPLTDEDNLQNLDKLDFDKLRPEFFEQVLCLRKRVLNRIKAKTLNGKQLSGDMYAGLIRNYTNAINEGAVPNIENAWHYICSTECLKASQAAIETYEKMAKDVLHNKLPLSLEDLKVYHKMAKDSALSIFKKKSVGEESSEYLEELMKKIKKKFGILKAENEKESQRVCMSFIHTEYSSIEKKLKSNEYSTLGDFEKELKGFHRFYLENGPKIVNRGVVVLEFLQKCLSEAANFFLRNSMNEADFQKTLGAELQKKLEFELRELKDEGKREKETLLMKVGKHESDIAELTLREANLQETVSSLKIEKEKNESELRSAFASEKSDLISKINAQKSQLSSVEESSKDIERQSFLLKSEFDKEKALLLQKVSYLEKSAEETNKKEKEQGTELKNAKKDHLSQIKEVSGKYEGLTKSLQSKVNELQERILELENDLATQEQKSEMEKKKWQLSVSNLNSTIDELESENCGLKRDLKDLRVNEERMNENVLKENEGKIEELEGIVKELKEKLEGKEEAYSGIRSAAEKDKAVNGQKIEFLEEQLKESKRQMEENSRAHDAILKALETNESERKMDNRQLHELKELHRKEIKALEIEFESTKRRLTENLDSLNEKHNDLELKSKFERNDFTKEIESLKEQLETLESAKVRLSESLKSVESAKAKVTSDLESRLQSTVSSYESQIEEMKFKFNRDLRDAQAKSEEALTQLRNFYEVEKERLEKRLAEEKDKHERAIEYATEEVESKAKEDILNLEDEIDSLREELRESEVSYSQLSSNFEHELAMKAQSILSLEGFLRDTKESLANAATNNAAALEAQTETFNKERLSLQEKMDTLSNDLIKRDRNIAIITQKFENSENALRGKELALVSMKNEFSEEKEALNAKIEELRGKFQEVSNEFLEAKIEFGKQLALTNQENTFSTNTINDLQSTLSSTIERYEEKLRLLKSEIGEEANERLSKIEEEKKLIETKYEKVKKSSKESEGNLLKSISGLEQKLVVTEEKLISSERRREELEQRLNSEGDSLSNQLQNIRETLSNERKNNAAMAEKQKTVIYSLETEKSELQATLEREKALWEGKIAFLENQRDTAKADLSEAVHKFETTVTHLKKSKTANQEQEEANLNSMITELESKYQSQISDLQETNSRLTTEYEDKIKRLEKELRAVNDKLLMEAHGKAGSQILTEKKLFELMENERRLMTEAEELRREKETKIAEFNRTLEKEKDSYRAKLGEIESILRETESKKSSLLFEHEKERAKWNLERDNLVQKKNEISETLERVEKKRESQLKEIEKLRSEARAKGKSNYSTNRPTKFGLNPSHSVASKNSDKGGLNDITNTSISHFDANNKTFSSVNEDENDKSLIGNPDLGI